MASFTLFAVLLLASTAAFASAGLSDCTCTREIDLVCNKKEQLVRTNLCYAIECLDDDINDIAPVECCNDNIVCTMDYNPICGDGVTYGNMCEAQCSGSKSLLPGECGSFVCACPMNEDPVCGSDGIMYANACNAECGGVGVVSADNCAIPYGGFSYKK